MNLLFVYVYPFNPQKGGVERVTDILARSFQAKGHDVRFLVFRRPQQDFSPAAPTDYFPCGDFACDENRVFFTEYVKTHAIDICIVQHPAFCPEIFKIMQDAPCKVVSAIHSDPTLGYKHFAYSFLRRRSPWARHVVKFLPKLLATPLYKRKLKNQAQTIMRRALYGSDAVVLLSERFAAELPSLGFSASDPKLKFIGNPCIATAQKTDNDKENIILFVGRMLAYKQPDFLIRIWNRLAPDYPDWKLVLVGDGDLLDYCKSLVKYPRQTVFTGSADPAPYYSKAKIVAMASIYEGFPMVLVEAMQYGAVPLTFASYGAVHDIIDPTCGVLARPFSKEDYIARLRTLIEDDALRQKLAAGGLQKLHDFDLKNITKSWIELFETII